jgi:acetyltransferase-like isoleucine patch superfamily enzyme
MTEFVRLLLGLPFRVLKYVLIRLPAFSFIKETRATHVPITLEMWFRQKVLGVNYGPYWPVHPTSLVVGWKNVLAGIETSPGYMPGCYIQAIGKIYLGDYTQVGPNVGLISANHASHDLRVHNASEIKVGRYCWLGMGSVILPGVILGDFTIVGANAVVTKSFPDGFCVIAGNPARLIRRLDPSVCIEHKSPCEYHGYIPKSAFDDFRKDNLYV